ncbi:hypothetical protein V8G54_017836, partial [Vigna mungo]
GVGLSAGPAIVIGSAASRARDGVPPQRTVAYVAPSCENAPAALGVHQKLGVVVFANEEAALRDGSATTGLEREEEGAEVAGEVHIGRRGLCDVDGEDRTGDEEGIEEGRGASHG